MSWLHCKVEIEGVEYAGMKRGNEVFVPFPASEALTIKVDGVESQVESLRVDARDGVAYITVKEAIAKPKKRRKSDDEPVEGRIDAQAGGEGVQGQTDD